MNRQQKRLEKQRRREHARSVERQRRIDADSIAFLMMDAELAWDERDFAAALRSLEKVLKIRPGHVDALEFSIETCFKLGRLQEGLSRYDKLREAPSRPLITYDAAVAAWRLGRLDRCKELADDFLDATRRLKEFRDWRGQAHELVNRVERTVKESSRSGESREPDLFKETVSAHASSAASRRETRSQEKSPPSVASAAAAAPALDLPKFPEIVLPEIPIRFEYDAGVLDRPASTRPAPAAEIFLRRDYALLRLQKGFDQMLSPGAVKNVEFFWYQQETVRRVLRDFRGHALLADEVGLGKTIEACFVLKEYWMRGLVRKALILTPPSLVSQWLEELASKFDMAAVSPETGGYAANPDEFWRRHDLIVASLALARHTANRERLEKIDYDLVVVDEAHYVKNRTTAAWQLVNGLKKRFMLLLSATPVGNDLGELYNLILLLRPGLLGTEAQFRRSYGQSVRSGKRALSDPERRDKLRGLLAEVMVRNTRAHIDLKLPRRLAATEKVTPSPMEAEVLKAVEELVRARYAQATPAERLRLMTLQMEAGSSLSALRYGLRDSAAWSAGGEFDAIAGKLAQIERSAKAEALIQMAARSREKKVVFTRFLATLEELRQALQSEGFSVSMFHGSLSGPEKENAIAEFRDRSEILLSSESGGEGRNLQFCNTVINYDLPWNPMAIEQRVGRVHRIGQTREVYVFNFCLAGSVEEYVLRVLHDKINLFELVAGEMEMILGELGHEQDFSSIVLDLWARSATLGERETAFDQFAEELQRAKLRYKETSEADQALFGEDYEV
jgi:SNF2 family DNA or RNA helicase